MRLHRSKLIKTTTKPVPSQVVSGFSAVYTYLKKKKKNLLAELFMLLEETQHTERKTKSILI